MKIVDFKTALVRTYQAIDGNHLFQMAAALSYYFLLSIFPALILLSVTITYLPVSTIFSQALIDLSRLLPLDEVQVISRILTQIITPHRGTFLSVGILGMLWTASSGFAASMEALNITYGAEETRPFWRTRPLALALTFSVGVMFFIVCGVMTVGPHMSDWFFGGTPLAAHFPNMWPYIHWMIAVVFTLIEVETLYFLAPNVKQSFSGTLPGASVAVAAWIALTYGMGAYFRSFAHFNQTYGVLGAAVAIMIWLYWAGFALLLGAQLNSELKKATINLESIPNVKVTGRSKSTLSRPQCIDETTHSKKVG